MSFWERFELTFPFVVLLVLGIMCASEFYQLLATMVHCG